MNKQAEEKQSKILSQMSNPYTYVCSGKQMFLAIGSHRVERHVKEKHKDEESGD